MRVVISVYVLISACALVAFATVFALPALATEWAASVAPAGITPAAKPGSAGAGARPVKAATEAKPAPSQPQSGMLPQTLYLVRSSLLALNDANRTGNYTVLRDLSSPSVRDRNSAADLAAVFAGLRKSKLDLAIAALMPPELHGPPMLDADKRMHVKGEYATQPERIVFELVFEAVNGLWQLSDLSISTRTPAQSSAKTAAAGQAR